LYDIRTKKVNKSEVAAHFNLIDHSVDDFNVCGLLNCANITERKLKESNLIHKLGTLVPLGLNREEF
jgi:hypothetical protein